MSDFRELYQTAACGLLTTNPDGVIVEVNDTFLGWSGFEREQLVGSLFRDHLETGSKLFYETRQMPVLQLQGHVREVSLGFVRSDGETLAVLLNAELKQSDGGSMIHLAVFDATSRQGYERDLLAARRSAEASEARVVMLQAATAAFAQSHSEQDVAEALFASAKAAFGATATGVFLVSEDGFDLAAGVNPLDGLIPADAPLASDAALVEGQPLTVSVNDDSGNYPYVTSGLRARNLEAVTILPLLRNGVALGVLACFYAAERDFDDQYAALQASLSRQASQAFVRVRLQNELERLALHDQLTGLANRVLLQDTVTRAVDASVETKSPLSVIFLDLDGFKRVNDQLGHSAGDAVLREVALRIRSAVRQNDNVGRYGGDEFVAVCESADELAANSIAERVRELIAQPIDGIPAGFSITASVGIATFTPGASDAPSNDEILSLADTAMYDSKGAGKDRVSHVRR